ncbi:hypothetical protein WR25_15088 [Diploscapter pachys]|uniref:C2H2-type domain-containing protein n=1 Tax=Diploscapter pachys TaxID=2018661 RepID=A0A2A2KCD7_9BILA|nr:hypothetical protein WR25_15088 [Diploscapter pachys]
MGTVPSERIFIKIFASTIIANKFFSTQMASQSQSQKRDSSGSDADNGAASDDDQNTERYKVPSLTDLSNRCMQFGNPHRYVLRFLMARGLVKKKHFIIHYLRYIAVHIMKLHYKVIEHVQANQKEIDELTQKIVACINANAKDLGLELVEHYDEESGVAYVVLITQLQQSKILSSGMTYNQDELYLLTSFVTEMAKNDGQMPHHAALCMGEKLPKPMTHAKVETFIDSLVRNKWIEFSGQNIRLQPRAIAELRTLFTDRYSLPKCSTCNKIVVNSANAAKCDDCTAIHHRICINRLFEQLDSDSAACSTAGCRFEFKKSDVNAHVTQTQTKTNDSDDSTDDEVKMIGYSYEQIDEQVLLYEEDSPSTSSMKNEYRPWVAKTDVGDINFVCQWNSCGEEFFDFLKLKSHVEANHLEYLGTYQFDSQIECPISGCSSVFADLNQLSRHITMHLFQARSQFVGYKEMLKSDEVKHIKSCAFEYCQVLYDGSVLNCSWKYCGMQFDDVTDLFDHVRTHVDLLDGTDRDEQKLHHCLWDLCEYKTTNKADLRRHVEHHSGEKSIACPFCSRFFGRIDNFLTHLKRNQRKESVDPSLQCQLCMKVCDDQKTLCSHVRRHFATKICDICGAAMPGPSMLNRHYQSAHTQRARVYDCPYENCNKTFYSQYDLICHQSVHEEPKFACETCGAKFRWKKVYEKHILQHQQEWSSRHSQLQQLLRSGDYEWISSVQKKFVGGGMASAVDVDAAVCIAEHKDQVNDIVDMLYKLRHTPNAANILASSEYAAVRLLLKHQPKTLVKLLNNPINYGIFLNDHTACMVIDYFLEKNDIQTAARIGTMVMQQEQMDNQLLNLLALHSCIKWVELPLDQQTMQIGEAAEEESTSEEDDREDEERTLKFPYLKNEYFDDHFDITNPQHLVGKTLLWVGKSTKGLKEEVAYSIQVLADLLYEKQAVLSTADWNKVLPTVKSLIVQRLTKQIEANPDEKIDQLLKKIGELSVEEGKEELKLSKAIRDKIDEIKDKEEKQLMEGQIKEFAAWNAKRKELVEVQAEKLQLKLKLEEIEKEKREIEAEKEKVFFFENRLTWEKKAERNEEIQKEMATTLKKKHAN